MLLAIGIGNTCVHLGLFEAGDLGRAWRIPTALLAHEADLGLRPEEGGAVQAVVACSVAPSVLQRVRVALDGLQGANLYLIEHAAQTGVPTRYTDPETVGIDRLVACRAARDLHGTPCVVVDMGTAVTFDAVSADGEHLGGAIAPGLGTSARALAAEAELLRDFQPTDPQGGTAIATSTAGCLDSGFVLGFAGMIDEMLRRMRKEMRVLAQAIATGGDAALVVPHCREVDLLDESLVLQGLRLIHEDNRTARE